MAYFDLDKYMTAEERIELFAKDNPDFRMISSFEILDPPTQKPPIHELLK